MTQEEKNLKQLLLKDLSARLPYGVIVHEEWEYQNPGVEERTKKEEDHIMNCYDLASITTIKPYLRPMSSMTEEEEKVFNAFLEFQAEYVSDADLDNKTDMYDWLLSRHLDFRGLIPMGLALEAPEGMYKQ